MAFVLGGITLPAGMIWRDQFQFAPVQQTVQYTIGGTSVITTASVEAARPITLVSLPDQGWLTTTQVEAIQALADVPGVVYPLIVNGVNYNVVFRHNDDPAVTFEPIIPRQELLPTDYHVGEIKLLTT